MHLLGLPNELWNFLLCFPLYRRLPLDPGSLLFLLVPFRFLCGGHLGSLAQLVGPGCYVPIRFLLLVQLCLQVHESGLAPCSLSRLQHYLRQINATTASLLGRRGGLAGFHRRRFDWFLGRTAVDWKSLVLVGKLGRWSPCWWRGCGCLVGGFLVGDGGDRGGGEGWGRREGVVIVCRIWEVLVNVFWPPR